MIKGKVLKQLIKQSSYTQRKIARELDVTDSYVSQQLNSAEPNGDFIQQVCELIGIDPKDAFSEIEIDYKSRYEALQEKYFTEKTQWLNQVQQLMTEVHSLKEENLKLREK